MKFVGNCNHIIDWAEVIKSLETQEPAYVGPRHDVGHDVPGIEEVGRPLRNAGYKFVTEGSCQASSLIKGLLTCLPSGQVWTVILTLGLVE